MKVTFECFRKIGGSVGENGQSMSLAQKPVSVIKSTAIRLRSLW